MKNYFVLTLVTLLLSLNALARKQHSFTVSDCAPAYYAVNPKLQLQEHLNRIASHRCATHFLYAEPVSDTFVMKSEFKRLKDNSATVERPCGKREYICGPQGLR